jgi:hypothetical protein
MREPSEVRFEGSRLPWLEDLLKEATSVRRRRRHWWSRKPRGRTPVMLVLGVGRDRRRRRYWEL